MSIAEIIERHGIEYLGRFYSVYRGIVISNKDTNNMNRILVNLPSILNGVEAWALPLNQDGNNGYGFKLMTPVPGQMVYIMFENGDPLRPLWLYHGWAKDEKPTELNNDTIGIITPLGNKIILNEKDGKLSIVTNTEINIQTPQMVLGDGDFGIPKSNSLVEKINTIENNLNAILEALNKAVPSSGAADGGLGLITSIQSMLTDISNIENTTIEDISTGLIKISK